LLLFLSKEFANNTAAWRVRFAITQGLHINPEKDLIQTEI
jgi:hypothetical protein